MPGVTKSGKKFSGLKSNHENCPNHPPDILTCPVHNSSFFLFTRYDFLKYVDIDIIYFISSIKKMLKRLKQREKHH